MFSYVVEYESALKNVTFCYLNSDEFEECKNEAGLFRQAIKDHAREYHFFAHQFTKETSNIEEVCLFDYLLHRYDQENKCSIIGMFYHNFICHEMNDKEETPALYRAVKTVFHAAAGNAFK